MNALSSGTRRAALAALACLTLPALAPAHEPGAHVHGVAELRIAVDGAQLDISLESPLDNLLGFEHAPRTELQRAAVRHMARTLRDAALPFTPSPAARCRLAGVTLASAALPPALLGEPGAAAAAAEGDGHADLDADFHWHCDAPQALDRVDVNLMTHFPGLRRLKVQVAAPGGQRAVELVPGQRSVRW